MKYIYKFYLDQGRKMTLNNSCFLFILMHLLSSCAQSDVTGDSQSNGNQQQQTSQPKLDASMGEIEYDPTAGEFNNGFDGPEGTRDRGVRVDMFEGDMKIGGPAGNQCERAFRCMDACADPLLGAQTCEICQPSFDPFIYVGAYLWYNCVLDEGCANAIDKLECARTKCLGQFNDCANYVPPTAQLTCKDVVDCYLICRNEPTCVDACHRIADEATVGHATSMKSCLDQNQCGQSFFASFIRSCTTAQCGAELNQCN